MRLSLKSRAVAVAVVSAWMLAACTSTASTHNTNTPPKPTQGGTLTVAAAQGISTLDPYEKLFQYSETLFPLLWNGLTAFSSSGGDTVQPQLAKSWDVSPDGKVYTFHLRTGIKFSNGQPMTAQDVVTSINRALDPKTAFFFSFFLPKISGVTALDPQTVRISLATANSQFPTTLTQVPIMNVSALSKINSDPVVTGPFKVQAFVPNVSLTLVPNPFYWGAKPYLDKMNIVNAQDSASAVSSLQSGGIDVLWGMPWLNVGTFIKNKSLSVNVVFGEPSMPTIIETDNTSPPFNNVKARQALSYATDRDAIVQSVYAGKAVPANTNQPISPMNSYFNSALPQSGFDLQKAKTLFTEAGVKSGTSLTYWAVGGTYGDWKSMGEILQSDLKKIGINLVIETPEVTTWAARFAPAGKKWPGLLVPNFFGAYPAPQSLDWWRPGICECNYSSTAFNDAMQAGYAATSKDSRKKYLDEAQSILAQDAPVVNVMVSSTPIGVRANVYGVWESPGAVLQLQGAHLGKK